MSKPLTSPLSVWAISIIVFIMVNAFIMVIFRSNDGYYIQSIINGPLEKCLQHILQKISEEKLSKPNEKFYVVLGSSLTENAIYCNAEFTRRSANDSTNIYTIFWYGHQLKLLHEYYNVFEELLSIQLDGVLFEADLLLYSLYRQESSNYSFWLRHQNYLKSFKIYLFNLFKETDCMNPVDHRVSDESSEFKFEVSIKKLEDTRFLHALFDKYRGSNISLYSLEIPRPEKTENYYRFGQKGQERKKLISDYEKEFGFRHIEFDQKMRLNHFKDHAHLNRKGQLLYSQWLFETISAFKTL